MTGVGWGGERALVLTPPSPLNILFLVALVLGMSSGPSHCGGLRFYTVENSSIAISQPSHPSSTISEGISGILWRMLGHPSEWTSGALSKPSVKPRISLSLSVLKNATWSSFMFLLHHYPTHFPRTCAEWINKYIKLIGSVVHLLMDYTSYLLYTSPTSPSGKVTEHSADNVGLILQVAMGRTIKQVEVGTHPPLEVERLLPQMRHVLQSSVQSPQPR